MLHFIKSGILTTIQDLGRNHYQLLGINPSGAMDKMAVRLINILLGNDENEGVIEMHFPAPEILFENDCQIAIGGADFNGKIGDLKIENWKIYSIKAGNILKFTKKKFGARAYLVIKGGFDIEKWLGSVSTNLLANAGGKLIEKGDRITFKIKNFDKNYDSNLRLGNSVLPNYYSKKIRILAGNEYQDLDKKSLQLLDNQELTIKNDSNRMGYRLEGKQLFLQEKLELISSAVTFGTIQLLPDGQLIILMADHQTTGGYPRIGHVIAEDLSILAQLNANDSIKFQIIDLKTAENLLISKENDLRKLKATIKLMTKMTK